MQAPQGLPGVAQAVEAPVSLVATPPGPLKAGTPADQPVEAVEAADSSPLPFRDNRSDKVKDAVGIGHWFPNRVFLHHGSGWLGYGPSGVNLGGGANLPAKTSCGGRHRVG